MAYSGLTIETAVSSATLDSHCIPAYPEYNSSTTFDATFYTARKASNDKLVGGTIVYKVV
jgi:hypothetical protein